MSRPQVDMIAERANPQSRCSGSRMPLFLFANHNTNISDILPAQTHATPPPTSGERYATPTILGEKLYGAALRIMDMVALRTEYHPMLVPKRRPAQRMLGKRTMIFRERQDLRNICVLVGRPGRNVQSRSFWM